MKRLLTIILVLSLSKIVFGQTAFNVSIDQTTDTVANQTDWAYFNASVSNLSNLHALNVTTTVFDVNVPFGWSITLCPTVGCLNPNDATATLTMLPLGEDSIQIQVFTDVMAIADGSFMVRFENAGDPSDFLEIELDVDYVPFVAPSGIDEVGNEHQKLSQNYPNPFVEQTTVRWSNVQNEAQLVISDLTGKILQKTMINRADGSIHIGKNLTSGCYFYSLIIEDKAIETRKLIKSAANH